MRLSPVCAVSSANSLYKDLLIVPIEFENDPPVADTYSPFISRPSQATYIA